MGAGECRYRKLSGRYDDGILRRRYRVKEGVARHIPQSISRKDNNNIIDLDNLIIIIRK